MAQAKSTRIEFAEDLTVENPGRKFTAGQIANHLNIDAKTFRGWMRKQTTERAEKGGRWEISEFDAKKLVERYENRKAGTAFRFKDDSE